MVKSDQQPAILRVVPEFGRGRPAAVHRAVGARLKAVAALVSKSVPVDQSGSTSESCDEDRESS